MASYSLSKSWQNSPMGARVIRLFLGAVGPENICGMNSDFRNIPTEDFAYFRGGVRTVYGLDDKLSHNVEICIRYKSSTNLLGT